MTSVIILVATTLLTSVYAALVSALADQHPELAGLLTAFVVLIWLLVGYLFVL